MTRQKKRAKTASRSTPAKPPPRFDLWIALLLLVGIAMVYSQVRDFEFINYDDPEYVTANAHVRNGLTREGVVWAFTSAHDANWIPLTWLSHMLDCQLFGLRSGFHHLTNVTLHAASAILLFILFKKLTACRWRSAFVAFLFALHPLHVESVAWVAERKDVLSALFFLLTIWAYIRYATRPAISRYCIVAALFCCALMSKPMVVTLPFVLLLLDFWPLKRPIESRLLVEKLPLFALSLSASAIAYFAQQHAGTVAALEHIPLVLRLENALVSCIAYIGTFVWPTNLAVFYPYPDRIAAWQWIGSGLVLGAVTFLIVRARRRLPYLAVGWLWFLVTLAPVIGLIQVGIQARADRYTYIPLIGIAIMLAWGAYDVFERHAWSKSLLAGLAVAVCGAWAAIASLNIENWRNSITLFQHAVESTRGNFIGYNNLGVALRSKRRFEEAIPQFETALRIRPEDQNILDNLGVALQTAGRSGEAIPHLRNAVRLFPDSYKAHVDLGSAFIRNGQADEAEAEYRRALQIRPDGAESHYGLGGILAAQGRVGEAGPHLQAGLPFLIEKVRDNPGDPDAHYNLGTLYGFMKRGDEAIAELAEAVRLAPGHAPARYNLGLALVANGRKAEAADQFAAAVQLQPESLNYRLSLARILVDLGRYEDAAHEYEDILRIDPGLPEARQNLEALKRSR